MRLPNLNELINAKAEIFHAGKRFSRYSQIKKKWMATIGWHIRQQKLKPVSRVFLKFTWHEQNKKRDPDNIAAGGKKLILDALVEMGILANDGWQQVAGWTDAFDVREQPGVTVEMMEDFI